jgi:DNA-binding MarR family transcriptional regulator
MGLLRRVHSHTDHRVVFVELSARGKRIVEKLCRQRMQELRRSGPKLIAALGKVISSAQQVSRNGRRGNRNKK